MDLLTFTEFYENLTIVVGIIYILSAFLFIFAQRFLISVQGKFIDFDEKTLKKFLYGYLALFKVVFIVFVIGPYLALVMMS